MAKQKTIEIHNRKAAYEYNLMDRYTAGIMLKGTEIKSLREGAGSIAEAYCYMRDGELYMRNMTIPEYSHGNLMNHDILRLRKLLLRKRELDKLDTQIRERGIAIIPVRLFISDRGFAKIEIAVARGKKSFDKRDSIKDKDSKRELARVMKDYKNR
jgi:SsrA-binding protein